LCLSGTDGKIFDVLLLALPAVVGVLLGWEIRNWLHYALFTRQCWCCECDNNIRFKLTKRVLLRGLCVIDQLFIDWIFGLLSCDLPMQRLTSSPRRTKLFADATKTKRCPHIGDYYSFVFFFIFIYRRAFDQNLIKSSFPLWFIDSNLFIVD
jgi:hypothetical protein